jgi:hypothetical protein
MSQRRDILKPCVVAMLLTASANMVSAEDVALYQNRTELKPQTGVAVTAYLGDPLINQIDGQYADCIVPKFSETHAKLGGAIIIKADIPICKTDASKKYYYPSYGTFNGAQGVVPVDIAYTPRRNGRVSLCVTALGMNVVCTSDHAPSDIAFEKRFIQRSGTIAKRLEFLSKSGNLLKLSYQETIAETPNPTITRELPIDLSDGLVVRYKGAVIQIEKADSTSITYTVLSGFDSANN